LIEGGREEPNQGENEKRGVGWRERSNVFFNGQICQWYLAEAEFDQSGSGVWHLRVAEGDHLSEWSEGRKLPQHKTRALAILRKLNVPLRGCSGGSAEGAEEGRSP